MRRILFHIIGLFCLVTMFGVMTLNTALADGFYRQHSGQWSLVTIFDRGIIIIDRAGNHDWTTVRHRAWMNNRAEERHTAFMSRSCLALRGDWRCPQTRADRYDDRFYNHWVPRRHTDRRFQ